MKERTGKNIDRYFRREDTLLAKNLKRLSPKKGIEYRRSSTKKYAEKMIAFPLAVASLPIVGTLATIVKIQEGGNSFYEQERVGVNGKPMKVKKIRSMIMNAEKDEETNKNNVQRAGISTDPRSTKLGKFMRPYGLDELPQLWQVINGDMSLVGCRANPSLAFDAMQEHRPKTHQDWHDVYVAAKPGIVNMNRAIRPKISDLDSRYHLDTFYGRKASLGLDLYLIFRTITGILKK